MADTVRTVSVALKMQITDFEAGAAKAAATMKGLSSEVDSFGKTSKTSFDGASKDVDGFGKSSKTGFDSASKSSTDFSRNVTANLKDRETAFQSMTARSATLRAEITKLRTSFATTGDKSVFGDLKQAEGDLKQIESILGDMGQTGEKAGNSFIKSFGQNASQMVPELVSNPVSLGIIAGVTAVAVPAITLAFEGAVTGGVGLGLIGAAALIQKNNPAIVAAVTGLKDDAVNVFKDASQPLVQPFVDALKFVDQLVVKEGPELQRIFTDLGPAVGLITHGLGALASDTLPNLDRVAQTFSAALKDPAVQSSVMGTDRSFQSLLRTIGDHPQTTADGFRILFDTMHTGIAVVNTVASAVTTLDNKLHQAYTDFQKLTGQPSGPPPLANHGAQAPTPIRPEGVSLAQWEAQKTGAAGAQQAFDGVAQSLRSYGQAAQTAALGAQALDDTQLNAAISANDFNASVTGLIGTLKDNKRSLNEHSAAGEADRGAILGIIASQKAAIPLWEKQGLTVDQATKKYNTNLTSLEKQLAANGQLTPAIQKLIDKYLAVPKTVNTNVSNTAAAAKKAIDGYKTDIENIPRSKTFTLHVVTDGNINQAIQLAHATGHNIASRWGGVYTHAADGLLSHAQTYTPVNPGRFMIAEPQTGGEAFIPKIGNYGRSMSILSAAAGWYGARVTPGSGSGSTPVVVNLYASDPGGRGLVNAIRLGVQGGGGNVVKVLAPR